MEWIKLSEGLPTSKDGIVQLWLPVEGLCAVVVGYQAQMFFKDGKEPIAGIMDEAREVFRDYNDFTHWAPLPKMPKDYQEQSFIEHVTARLRLRAEIKKVTEATLVVPAVCL